MKKRIAVAVMLAVVGIAALAHGMDDGANGPDFQQREILDRIQLYLASVDNAEDASIAEQLWLTTSESTFIHPRGHERGWDAIKKNFYGATMTDAFSKRELSAAGTPEIYVYGNVAVAEFDWEFAAVARTDGAAVNTKGRETQVFVRDDAGEWWLAHVHYSGPAATAAQ